MTLQLVKTTSSRSSVSIYHYKQNDNKHAIISFWEDILHFSKSDIKHKIGKFTIYRNRSQRKKDPYRAKSILTETTQKFDLICPNRPTATLILANRDGEHKHHLCTYVCTTSN